MKALNEMQEDSSVSLTPLIDVVFLLIVFFLVGTTFYKVEKDLSIRLPSASSGAESILERQRVVINIREGGLTILNGRIVTEEQLAAGLAAAARKDPSVEVVIRGDRKAFHEDVVRVLNECIVVGITNINVAVYPVVEGGAPSAEKDGA